MYYHCQMPIRSVSEYHLESLRDPPKLLIVTAARTLNEKAWHAIREFFTNGSTVLLSGPIDTDDHWLPVDRSREFGVTAMNAPVEQEELLSIDGVEYRLSYRG